MPVENGDWDASKQPGRRTRYQGTHPWRFEDRYKELDPQRFPEMQEHIRDQGRTPAGTHVPVLLQEVVDRLEPKPGDLVADCTIGYGGHARAFHDRIGAQGLLVGLDVDEDQLARTQRRLERGSNPEGRRNFADESQRPDAAAQSDRRIHLVRSHFAGLGKVMRGLNLSGFDIVFADLGASSMQIDDPARGFGYKMDGPLDMRMDLRLPRTAADWLNQLSVQELGSALRDLADEPDHEAIARTVEQHRRREPLRSTSQLVSAVLEAKGISRSAWRNRIRRNQDHSKRWSAVAASSFGVKEPKDLDSCSTHHPAARTFQALRILVNDELNGLAQFLRAAPYCLKPGGRIGVIGFHSGEDRLVKRSFREGFRAGTYDSICDSPIRPSLIEKLANPRSSSAKFRWARMAQADGSTCS